MELIQITTQDLAQKASDFLSTYNAFEDSKDWNEEEVRHLVETPFKALGNLDYYGWIMLENEKVIGYIDLRRHEFADGGYYSDWFAVHKDYRGKGIGSNMLSEVEKFAKSINARYILIETGDIDFYIRTRNFYEKNGFKQVGHIPEYYYKNWGMYIYQKMLIV